MSARWSVSPLVKEWFDVARSYLDGQPGDHFFVIEDKDPRVHFDRSVASGGVSDGRPSNRGVILLAVTSDGCQQEFGVSSKAQAENVLKTLFDAWPELRESVPA